MRYWKRAVHIRDKICQSCGHPGSKKNPLTVHHIKPKCFGENNSLENLILLCTRCHKNLHQDKGYPTRKRKKGKRRKRRRY